MIEVQVPKDVSVYESPLVGPLTARDESFIKRYQPLEMLSALRKKG